MTEIENLKALLREARTVVAGTISAQGLMQRIDAALAEHEPVIEWEEANGYYYAHKRELLAEVATSPTFTWNGFRWNWRVTLANGKREHNFRYGTAGNIETAMLLAEAALKEIR